MTIATDAVVRADFILLTDDEAAAAAAALYCPWPSSLPTVANDIDSLRDAIVRGRRSLAVRGLLVRGEDRFGRLADELAALLEDCLADGAVCGVLVTDEQLGPLDLVPAFFHFGGPDGDQWLTDILLPGGVHKVGASPRIVCLQLLAGLVGSVYASGLALDHDESDGPLPWLCVMGAAGSNRALLVRCGALGRTVLTADGPARVEDAQSVDEALAWLGITL